MLTSSLNWPMVVIISIVLGGASFLGYAHVLTGDFVGSIYGAVISGAAVGHFATSKTG